jgi:ankyrin repeat protein
VKSLLDNGADFHFKDRKGGGLLHSVCTLGDPSAAELLIEKGFPIDLQNNKGYTPLHVAIQNGQVSIVKLLIECGADVKIQDKVDGRTPLHAACGDERTLENTDDDELGQIIRELILAGADTQMTDIFGLVPYDLLVQGNENDDFSLLMEAFKRSEEEARIVAQYPEQPVLK